MTYDTAARVATAHKSRHSGGRPDVKIGRIVAGLMGLLILILALPPFFNFPRLGFWLLPVAAMYLLLLGLVPRLWLIVLPLATVGLDITPWTGRFAYNELDLIFIVTLSSGLLYGRYRFSVYSPGPAMFVLLLYLCVVFLGYRGWSYFLLPPQAALDNPYYSTQYAYKVLKGLVWGVSLVPMWGYLLAVDKQRAVRALTVGMSLSALLLFFIVLWERHTLDVIFTGSAWYEVVKSVLDLASSYRVTAMFSDMHTGGEAIDGVVLMLLPACLFCAIYGRTSWVRLLGAVGFMALAYVTLVGFTRATYAAFALALVIYGGLTMWSRQKSGLSFHLPLAWLGVTLCVAIVTALVAYRFAGAYGLASFGALLMLAYISTQVKLTGIARHLPSAAVIAFIALAVNAHFSSRWVQPSTLAWMSIAMLLATSYLLALKLFVQSQHAAAMDQRFLLGVLVVLPVGFAFALGGTQINSRMTQVSDDLETRESHWSDVIASAEDGAWRKLFGNGVGSFPARYIGTHPETVRDVGSFNVVPDLHRHLLRLGGGQDLSVGQRVAIEPYTSYSLSIGLEAERAGNLGVALCERNLIYASNFVANCVNTALRFDATEGGPVHHVIEINSGRVGARGALGRWPTILSLYYQQPGTVLEIDDISLSVDGFNLLHNSDFSHGMDYWFHYDDFSHLPWHVKNVLLQVWFESGWLGLALFLILLGMLLHTNLERHAYDSLIPVYTTAVVSVVVFGMFGSPLDSARVSWMFYFFLCAGLAKLRVTGKSRVAGAREGSSIRQGASRSGRVKTAPVGNSAR